MKKLILFIVLAGVFACHSEDVDPKGNNKSDVFDPQDWHLASLYEYNQYMDSAHVERFGILWELDLEAMRCDVKRLSSMHGISREQYDVVYPENGDSWDFRVQECSGLAHADFTYIGNYRFTVVAEGDIKGLYTEEGVIGGEGYPDLYSDDKIYFNSQRYCLD